MWDREQEIKKQYQIAFKSLKECKNSPETGRGIWKHCGLIFKNFDEFFEHLEECKELRKNIEKIVNQIEVIKNPPTITDESGRTGHAANSFHWSPNLNIMLAKPLCKNCGFIEYILYEAGEAPSVNENSRIYEHVCIRLKTKGETCSICHKNKNQLNHSECLEKIKQHPLKYNSFLKVAIGAGILVIIGIAGLIYWARKKK